MLLRVFSVGLGLMLCLLMNIDDVLWTIYYLVVSVLNILYIGLIGVVMSARVIVELLLISRVVELHEQCHMVMSDLLLIEYEDDGWDGDRRIIRYKSEMGPLRAFLISFAPVLLVLPAIAGWQIFFHFISNSQTLYAVITAIPTISISHYSRVSLIDIKYGLRQIPVLRVLPGVLRIIDTRWDLAREFVIVGWISICVLLGWAQ